METLQRRPRLTAVRSNYLFEATTCSRDHLCEVTTVRGDSPFRGDYLFEATTSKRPPPTADWAPRTNGYVTTAVQSYLRHDAKRIVPYRTQNTTTWKIRGVPCYIWRQTLIVT
jgi:hypothetical protein